MNASIGISAQNGALGWLTVAACCVATVVAGGRWLRVAQREHYLPDAVSRFAVRWWWCSPANAVSGVLGLAGLVVAGWLPVAGLVTAAVVAVAPFGLSIRGRTAPLALTRRLRTLAAVWVALQAGAVAAGVVGGEGALAAAAAALAAPALVDVALALTAPAERRLAGRFVDQATARLRRVNPTVVAITGSYGKTSTKGYVAHLAAARRSVVASPASFNNRAGLARTVNEHLAPGTEVFVAEMGTYRHGEIAALCRWIPPDIAVITAIGPVHLERFGTEDRIVEAKSEILTRAPVVVLAVDDVRLARLAERCEAEGKRVWRCATTPGVAAGAPEPERVVVVTSGVSGLDVAVGDRAVAKSVPSIAQPGNVACAVAVALELGVPDDAIAERIASLPTAAHRLEPGRGASGSIVLDDTYNANPAGAAVAVARLAAEGAASARRVVVTPGMVELGRRQREENARFAEAAATVATDVVVVGRTNRAALVAGVRAAVGARLHVVSTREQAVAWVRDTLGPGDAVLYENDLPDHYP